VLSHRAAAVAVAVAFFVGLVGSLALRPAGERPPASPSDDPSQDANLASRVAKLAWRTPGAFQTTMPVLGDNILYVSRALREASGGRIDFKVFEPGELVPAFSITDAVSEGKIQAGYTWLGYDQGKVPASALLGAVPFGMEPWEFSAWWYEAGGRELGIELYEPYNLHPVFCGITGPETAGWFRERIDDLDDLKGLKIRFAGIGGKVLERLGASVTMLPGGEIFQALEKGAIDATEFALPIVDQSLGFNRVARYNYYPGWHQPATGMHLVVNRTLWNTLAAEQQALIEMACTAGVTRNLARSEALQGEVMAQFPANGVSAETLPEPVLRQLEAVATQVLDEEAAKDPMFAKILKAQRAFRETYSLWKSRAYLPRDF
jgi:TRAP-type mannitol/chloroaromatic compound transport system substrate-binding protein